MAPDFLSDVGHVSHGGVSDPEVLDFSANTNPVYPPGTVQAYDAALSASRRYPADGYTAYRTAAGDYVGCEPRQVVPTAGGLVAIRLALRVAVAAGDTVLVPEPSFGEYDREVRLLDAEPSFVPYDAVLDADPEPHAAAVVCNPNNPTGNAYDDAALRAFAERCRDAGTVLLVDEAFLDFTDRPSLAGTSGVVAARSLTKMFGLPGLRAGFAAATGELRDRLDAIRPAWSLSTPAADVGVHCMRQGDFVEETRRRVDAERARIRAALADPFDVHPSDAPFLLCDVGAREVDAVVDAARRRGIAVRDATTFRGLDSHVRVAVKRPEENDRLLDALAHV
ncbi:threonine-phosphate decarboxylase CobD [Halegenticoccus tardaugens]|uniref:threonine-phosphate decarboxylase CobD n=1 Tax=Halegenticoccus tardaugens TaxID=2071624 RepID=UPI00100A94AA|nr:threonine-phosphate decarboxylase CobD [Halegenticoccus tardaugens]